MDDEGWNLPVGRGRGGIVIVDIPGKVRQIMASAVGATERVKGDVWVHRWQLVAVGNDGKGGGMRRGGGVAFAH